MCSRHPCCYKCQALDPSRPGLQVKLNDKNPTVFRALSTLLHLSGVVHFFIAALYDWFATCVPSSVSPIYESFASQFKFLTYWNVCIQALYMTYSFAIDIAAFCRVKETKLEPYRRIKENVEASIALPIAIFVGFTFWGLMAIDRELVLPKKVDGFFPNWLNHMEHTSIVLFQILELLTSPRTYPSHRFGITCLGIFQMTYIAWMHVVYYQSGLWVYPILAQLSLPGRVLFLAGSVGVCFCFYFLGYFTNWLLWKKGNPIDRPNIKYSTKSDIAE